VQDCSTHTTALSPQGDSRADLGVELQNQSEQFRPAIVSGMGDHHVETSTSSLSFRFSELSQPSEVLFLLGSQLPKE